MDSKKGSQMNWDMIFPIFQFILTIAVFLILMKFVLDVSNGTSFEKNYYARDIALLTDTIEAAPGEVVYYYPNKISEYELGVDIEENLVVIRDTDPKFANIVSEGK